MYGKLTAKKAEAIPWARLLVDLIGPYKNKIEGHYDPLILKILIITYDQENEFLRHAFIKYIIETENGIKTKGEATKNPQAN